MDAAIRFGVPLIVAFCVLLAPTVLIAAMIATSTRFKRWSAALGNNSGWALWALLMVLSGIPLALKPTEFGQIVLIENLTIALVRVLGALLTVAGSLILLGTVRRNGWIERAGHAGFITALAVDVYVLVITGTWNRFATIVLIAACCLASLARYRRIGARLRIQERIEEVRHHDG